MFSMMFTKSPIFTQSQMMISVKSPSIKYCNDRLANLKYIPYLYHESYSQLDNYLGKW